MPILLPLIPGRTFAFKGGLLGLLWTAAVIVIGGGIYQVGITESVSFLLLLPSISAYTATNFTGSSTYTSHSGINMEMRIAIPIMLIASVCGVILLPIAEF